MGGADDDNYIPDELAFSKADYFRVEKWTLIFGWGRWAEILDACEFKQSMSHEDIEHMCRTVLLHCLRTYSGDEKVGVCFIIIEL
jgi:chromodomain-helicase-DNA-binding protein 7